MRLMEITVHLYKHYTDVIPTCKSSSIGIKQCFASSVCSYIWSRDCFRFPVEEGTDWKMMTTNCQKVERYLFILAKCDLTRSTTECYCNSHRCFSAYACEAVVVIPGFQRVRSAPVPWLPVPPLLRAAKTCC